MANDSTPILDMFLGSLPRHTFLDAYWGQRMLQSSSQALLDLQLFGLQDFVKIAAFLRPCDGRLRLVQDGAERWRGGFDQERVFPILINALSRGMTASLERLDLFWPPVVELCGALSAELGCPVHANAYLTPPGAPGLDPHYDTHDVFVLHLEGEKSWTLGQIEHTLPTERTADGVVTEMRAHTQLRVRPGDVLYIPRGMAHSARSEASHSLHLTIGCIPDTFGDEITRLVLAAAHQVPALRASVEPSAQPPETRRARISTLLGQMAELLAADALQPPARRSARPTERCYKLDDAFSQLRTALDIAGISSTSKLVLHRPEDIELVEEGERGFVLRGGARSVRLDDELLPAVRAILATSGVFSLPDLPSEVSSECAVRAVVRMLSSSFLRVADRAYG